MATLTPREFQVFDRGDRRENEQGDRCGPRDGAQDGESAARAGDGKNGCGIGRGVGPDGGEGRSQAG